MIRMTRWLLFSLLLSLGAKAQPGIRFEKGLSWSEIREKAKAENKPIFLDAYTTWCGPCIMMARTVFTREDVGEFFNANFINVKVQLDTTSRDNEEVRRWYADAHEIMTAYGVRAFPTYLFFTPDGELAHRELGASDAQTFIEKGRNALNPQKQYYTLARQYRYGKRNPDFLRGLALAAYAAMDYDDGGIYVREYLMTQRDLLTKENMEFLKVTTQSSADPGFTLMRENPQKFDELMGRGKSAERVRVILLSEKVFPQMPDPLAPPPDWTKMEKELKQSYGDHGVTSVLHAKAIYHANRKEWKPFTQVLNQWVDKYPGLIDADLLNSYAWNLFQQCDDAACLRDAVKWSQKAIEWQPEDAELMDTYANLLYKTKNTREALTWQQKSIDRKKALGEDAEEHEERLAKMKKGEPTW